MVLINLKLSGEIIMKFKHTLLSTLIFAGLQFGLIATAHAITEDATYESGRTSLVEPIHQNGKTYFIVRGSNVNEVTDFNSGSFLQTVINAIKQSDPVEWQNDFANAGMTRFIKIVDVKLNSAGSDSTKEVALFTNFTDPKVLKKWFEARVDAGQPIYADPKNSTQPFTDSDGNTYQVKSQMIFNLGKNEITPQMAKLTQDATDDLVNSASDDIVIFYVHCTHGKDRTGVQSSYYQINSYLKDNVGNIDTAYLTSLISKGFIKWDTPGETIDVNGTGYNVGKDIYSSSFYKTLPTLYTTDFPQVTDWSSIIPASNELVAPSINDYASTLSICKNGYGSNCLSVTNSKDKLIWKNADVSLNSSLTGYSFYVSYVSKNGVPIKTVAVNTPQVTSDGASITLESVKDATEVKLYVFNANATPVSIINKTKYDFVGSAGL